MYLWQSTCKKNKSGLHSILRISHFLNNKFLENWKFVRCFNFFSSICYRHILSCPSLYWASFFIQSENLYRHSVSRKSISAIFPIVCSLHISMSHFGNSSNTSNFFIIIIFVMEICDQWFMMLLCNCFEHHKLNQWICVFQPLHQSAIVPSPSSLGPPIPKTQQY